MMRQTQKPEFKFTMLNPKVLHVLRSQGATINELARLFNSNVLTMDRTLNRYRKHEGDTTRVDALPAFEPLGEALDPAETHWYLNALVLEEDQFGKLYLFDEHQEALDCWRAVLEAQGAVLRYHDGIASPYPAGLYKVARRKEDHGWLQGLDYRFAKRAEGAK